MPRPKLRVVSKDEVRISRENGDTAVFEYADSSMGGGMRLQVGPKVMNMSDRALLELHNDMVKGIEYSRRQHEYVAVEIPVGKPQIKYSAPCQQWSPRGNVLRCFINDGGEPDEEGKSTAQIEIDNKTLTLDEFGRLLTTYAGWGMRIVFVPDHELHEKPKIRIQDPEDQNQPQT